MELGRRSPSPKGRVTSLTKECLVRFIEHAAQFTIRLPAQRFQPDVFYVNEFARRLHDKSRDDFNRLF